jgi:hypothetical protein
MGGKKEGDRRWDREVSGRFVSFTSINSSSSSSNKKEVRCKGRRKEKKGQTV